MPNNNYQSKITLHLDLDSDSLKKELEQASKSFNGFGADFEKNVTDALESITKNIQKQSEVWSKLLEKGLSVNIGNAIEKNISQSITNGIESGVRGGSRKISGFNLGTSGKKYKADSEQLFQMSDKKALAHFAKGFDSATKQAIDEIVTAKRELAKLRAQFQKEQFALASEMKADSLTTTETDYTKVSNRSIVNAIKKAEDRVTKAEKALEDRRKSYAKASPTTYNPQHILEYQTLSEKTDKQTQDAKKLEQSYKDQSEQINKVVEAVKKLNEAEEKYRHYKNEILAYSNTPTIKQSHELYSLEEEIDNAKAAVDVLKNDPATIEAGIKIIEESGKWQATLNELQKAKALLIKFNDAFAEYMQVKFNPVFGITPEENEQIKQQNKAIEERFNSYTNLVDQLKSDPNTSQEVIKLIEDNAHEQMQIYKAQEKAAKEVQKEEEKQRKAEEKIEAERKKAADKRKKFALKVAKGAGKKVVKGGAKLLQGVAKTSVGLVQDAINLPGEASGMFMDTFSDATISGMQKVASLLSEIISLSDRLGTSPKAQKALEDVNKLSQKAISSILAERNVFLSLQKAIIDGDEIRQDKLETQYKAQVTSTEGYIAELKKAKKEVGAINDFASSAVVNKTLSQIDEITSQTDRLARNQKDELAEKALKTRLELQKKINALEIKQKDGLISPNEIVRLEEYNKKFDELTEKYRNIFIEGEPENKKFSKLLTEYNGLGAQDKAHRQELQAEAKEYDEVTKRVLDLQKSINSLQLSFETLDEDKDKDAYNAVATLLTQKIVELQSLEGLIKEDDKVTRDKLNELIQKGQEATLLRRAGADDKGRNNVSKAFNNLVDKVAKSKNSLFNNEALSKAYDILSKYNSEQLSAVDAAEKLNETITEFGNKNSEYEKAEKTLDRFKSNYQKLTDLELQNRKLIERGTPLSATEKEESLVRYRKASELRRETAKDLDELIQTDKRISTDFAKQARDARVQIADDSKRALDAFKKDNNVKELENRTKALERLNKAYRSIRETADGKGAESAFRNDALEIATEIIERFKNKTLDAKDALSQLNVVADVFARKISEESKVKDVVSQYEKLMDIELKIVDIQNNPKGKVLNSNGKEIGKTLTEDQRSQLADLEAQRRDLSASVAEDMKQLIEWDNRYATNYAENARKEMEAQKQLTTRAINASNQDRANREENAKTLALAALRNKELAQAQSEYNKQLDVTIAKMTKVATLGEDVTVEDVRVATKEFLEAEQKLDETRSNLENKLSHVSGGDGIFKDILSQEQARFDEAQVAIDDINAQAAARAAQKKQLQEQKELQNQYIALLREEYSIRTKIEKYATKKGARPDDAYYTQLQKRLAEIGDDTTGEMGGIFSKLIDDDDFNERVANIKSSLNNNLDQVKASVQATLSQIGSDIEGKAKEADDAQQLIFAHLESQYENFKVTTPWDGTKLTAEVLTADGAVKTLTYTWNQFDQKIRESDNNVKNATGSFSKLGKGITNLFNQMGRMIAGYMSINAIFNAIRQGVGYVKELDTAMNELKLVTQASDREMSNYASQAANVASALATTTAEVIKSQTEWARLGYSAQDSLQLAYQATALAKSGFMSVEDATSQLTSSLQAFFSNDIASGVISAGDAAQKISDELVYIGNNYAITSEELGGSLQRSAAAMVAAGNSLEETIALTTAGNTIQQDAAGIGTALRVVSMRIRGVKADKIAEDIGESVDVVDTSFAKLYEDVKKLTSVKSNDFQGVSILTDAGNFKSTYEILRDISRVWNEIGDASQAALLETLAGRFLPECTEMCA